MINRPDMAKVAAILTPDTLETEIKKFISELTYWERYLAVKVLAETALSDEDIDTTYQYLLEELGLIPETEKPEIEIVYNSASTTYNPDLLLTRLENVEGVNALAEGQVIDFTPQLTIIYGANGSGKSGYVRLLKNIFYSKAPEDILPNIHIPSGHKAINANFTFSTGSSAFSLNYITDKNKIPFKQFAVFDGKSVIKQLDHKNEFEFRPAGLNFFSEYSQAIDRVENKLKNDILIKQQTAYSLADISGLFEGESEVKTTIQNLSIHTKLDELKGKFSFSETDEVQKKSLEKQYDDLSLASKEKEKTIKNLTNIKALLATNKSSIELVGKHLSTSSLGQVRSAIAECSKKINDAKSEGIENFRTELLSEVGSPEWKNFILAADAFAKKQTHPEGPYPQQGDNCLFCHQSLTKDAEVLISKYWSFIQGTAEARAKSAQDSLDKFETYYRGLNFDLFSEENILTGWLRENHPTLLDTLKNGLSEQKKLVERIILDIQNKTDSNLIEVPVDSTQHDVIGASIDTTISLMNKDEQSTELKRLFDTKTAFVHKEKFNLHISKIETYLNNHKWIKMAQNANFQKRRITETDKNLSDKYFNQAYVTSFNEECELLDGSFGIEISHTGSAGKSYRQLKLKGNNPHAVLSEGEQKVIAIADFLAEMSLSEMNRGIVFDDPVTSLDEKRKGDIARRLVHESRTKQTIIFTHDLVFVSNLLVNCDEGDVCHWIESRDSVPGYIFANNAPSYEKEYRNSAPAKKHLAKCSASDCAPMDREAFLRQGFTALRTCYEVLVINDLFSNVVQRYNERVSVDSLSKVYITDEIKVQLLDSFAQCCRYMEGHTHSDQYAYKKPETQNLQDEIGRYEALRKMIRDMKK